MTNFSCGKCNIRLPKNRPLLVCSICREFKHYKCNNMSKSEAIEIINFGRLEYWTCQDCFGTLFPNITDFTYNKTSIKTDTTRTNILTNCGGCNKPCSSNKTLATNTICQWCDQPCHRRCLKNTLGCTSCCNDIIPGYNYSCHQITYSILSNNHTSFSPYNRDSLVNQIGDSLDTDEGNYIWAELAEQIRKCNYTKVENIKMARPNELRVMSLNIRSLSKNIDYVRENFNDFAKFDILCFCETNCNTDNLPNSYNDILIDGFHTPFTQNPYRKSNKGGGLAIYVNRRVCDVSDLELLDL